MIYYSFLEKSRLSFSIILYIKYMYITNNSVHLSSNVLYIKKQ